MVCSPGLILSGDELQRGAVDAVAQAGGAGAVLKNVAKVASAACTLIFRAIPAVFVIRDVEHVSFFYRSPKARPSTAGFVFGFGMEKREIAGLADEDSLAFFLQQRAGAGAFGAILPQDVEFKVGQDFAPLGLGFFHRYDAFGGFVERRRIVGSRRTSRQAGRQQSNVTDPNPSAHADENQIHAGLFRK